jgi:hypothetical protein
MAVSTEAQETRAGSRREARATTCPVTTASEARERNDKYSSRNFFVSVCYTHIIP